MAANPALQEPLIVENIPDDLAGEQVCVLYLNCIINHCICVKMQTRIEAVKSVQLENGSSTVVSILFLRLSHSGNVHFLTNLAVIYCCSFRGS